MPPVEHGVKTCEVFPWIDELSINRLSVRPCSATVKTTAKITADLAATTRTGGTIMLSKAAMQELQASLRGPMLLASSEGYDEVRQVWNGMIDKRPGLIVRCLGAADVKNAVDFARSNDLLVALRGGGHSISGKSVCEGAS